MKEFKRKKIKRKGNILYQITNKDGVSIRSNISYERAIEIFREFME